VPQQQQQQAAAANGDKTAAAHAGSRAFGCSSCKAARYCSHACADAAREVHAANCWCVGGCWERGGVLFRCASYRKTCESSTCACMR
jgi:hypothetical protein